ncbi:MAG: uroporphyrinogen-III synthase [Brumimicrobium sp.]
MSVFISKKLSDVTFETFLKSKGVELIEQPMISFCPIPFSLKSEDEYEIIFFASPRAVIFFLNNVKVKSTIKIATIGKATSKAVVGFGHIVDFEGEKSGNPQQVAKAFKNYADTRKVLFPQSTISHRSIQKLLPKEQVINLTVYKTELNPIKLQDTPSILVFTSPSNVEAFLKMNTLSDQKQKVIAWGETTARFLEKSGVSVFKTLQKSSSQELIKVLEEIL